MPSVSPYDHLVTADTGHPDGIYRVVGRAEDGVVVLRVADAEGRRVHEGEVRRLDADELDGFEPAANPDGDRSALAAFSSPATLYWSVRAFVDQLRAHPVASLLSLAVLSVGTLGGAALPLGEAWLDGLLVLGGLGLAYVGSGRL